MGILLIIRIILVVIALALNLMQAISEKRQKKFNEEAFLLRLIFLLVAMK